MESSPPASFSRRFRAYLRAMGAGSLTLSLLLHGLFLLVFSMIVWERALPVTAPPEGFVQVLHAQSPPSSPTVRSTQIHQTARIVSLVPESAVTLADVPLALENHNALSSFTGSMGIANGTQPGGGLRLGSSLTTAKLPPSFLQLPAVGDAIIFVIDTSGSMVTNCQPTGIAAIRRELDLAITALPNGSQFNLICFGQDADLFQPECVRATTANKLAALEFFKFYYQGARTRSEKFGPKGVDASGTSYTSIKAEDVPGMAGTSGGSRMDLALAKAFTLRATTIFLLSDGEPGTSRNGKPMEKSELLHFMEQSAHTAHSEKTIVNTIAVNEEARSFLKKIAHRFNGKFKAVQVE